MHGLEHGATMPYHPTPGVFRWTFNLRSRAVGRERLVLRELQAENGKNERLEEDSIIFYHKNLRII